jgi:hypothetical protein
MDRFFAQFTAGMTQYAKVALVVLAVGCFGVVALGCVIASVWIFAIPQVGVGGAPLVAAIPLVILSIGGCLLVRRLLQPRGSLQLRGSLQPSGLLQPKDSLQRSTPPAAPDTTVMVVAAATRLAQEQPATALAAALIAGVLAGITRPK